MAVRDRLDREREVRRCASLRHFARRSRMSDQAIRQGSGWHEHALVSSPGSIISMLPCVPMLTCGFRRPVSNTRGL